MSENPLQPNTTADGRPRKVRRRCVRACVGLVCLVRLFPDAPVCLAQDTPLKISEETTYITEPLTADGKKVDYFAAFELKFYPENMKTDDNGYRLVVENLGDLANYPVSGANLTECGAQTLEELGLDREDTQSTMTFNEPGEFLVEYFASSMPDGLNGLAVQWFEENGAALDLMGEAVRKPSFHMPMVRYDEIQPLSGSTSFAPHSLMRSFARGLSARASYRVARGDIDGAIDDILACKRLGRHVGRDGRVIGALVGIAIEGIAGSVGIAASLEHQPSGAQLQRLFDEWEDLPPRMDIGETMLSERYFALDAVQGIAHGDFSTGDFPDGASVWGFANSFACDWNVVARRVNELYDNFDEGIAVEKPNSLSPLLLFPAYRSRVVGDLLGHLFIPAMEAYREADRRTACSENLHRITLAMLIHERRHGTLPPAYTVDTEGVPLHSWRVLLLPYLGQQELYDKIRLGEAWDSEHNRTFHDQAVAFYQCPTAALAPGQTTYSVVVGPDMPFEAGEGRSRSDLGPQSENMILIVECAGPVCWMDPTQEVPQAVAEEGINLSDPVTRMPARGNGIASGHSGGAQAGRLDGSVRFYSEVIDAEVLRQLLNGTNDSRDD